MRLPNKRPSGPERGSTFSHHQQSCHPQPTPTTGRGVFAGGTGPWLSLQASTTSSLCFGHHRRLPSSTRVAPVRKGAPSWLRTPCTAVLQLREWLWNQSQVHSRLVLQSSDHGLHPGRCLHASPSACSSPGRLLGLHLIPLQGCLSALLCL